MLDAPELDEASRIIIDYIDNICVEAGLIKSQHFEYPMPYNKYFVLHHEFYFRDSIKMFVANCENMIHIIIKFPYSYRRPKSVSYVNDLTDVNSHDAIKSFIQYNLVGVER